MTTKSATVDCIAAGLSASVYDALRNLLKLRGIEYYSLQTVPISTPGENSYGQVLKTEIRTNKLTYPIYYILKLSPKNPARRKQMNVVAYYTREVFIYDHVLKEFQEIQEEYEIPKRKIFASVPKMWFSSLNTTDEFIIFEDLQQSGYLRHDRRQPLTFQHTALALQELARFHAMSFIVKTKKPQLFWQFVNGIRRDNLFNEDLEEVSVEFAKKYIGRTMMVVKDEKNIVNKNKILAKLEGIREQFNEICMKLVDGDRAEPYSVICHGDFWNNNILYKYENGSPVSAKILDFQMSRYASPVLDFVHYIFTCTEKSLRDQHFADLKRIYHSTLANHLRLFNMNPEVIFPYAVFEGHLTKFGFYGFCISVFAIPFFITEANDIPDLDEFSEAVSQMYEIIDSEEYGADGGTSSNSESERSDRSDRTSALLDEFEMLNESTIPIFRRRMTGIVQDLDKYGMFNYEI